jgi:transposase
MGRRGYPLEFRRKVLDLAEAGRPIAQVAKALGISAQWIYTWRRQDRIDKGLTQAGTVVGPGSRSGPAAARHFGFCYPIGRRTRQAAL